MTSEEVPAELVEFANELADAAGGVILRYWRHRSVAVESKNDAGRPVAESPVTIADRGAEKAMRALILARYPSHGILGEEFGTIGNPMQAEYAWVLDPIDGTKSFITGKPLFGTLIALVRYGTPVLGIVDQCVLQERWVGTSVGGTTLNGVAVRSSSPSRGEGTSHLNEAMVYATTPEMFAQGSEARGFASLRSCVKRTLYGCDCYAYALCASGFVDLVCEADLLPYDYLALVPVLEGAGAVISDWDGRPLTLANHSKSKGRVIAAANAELHVAALAALRTAPPPDHAERRTLAAGVFLGALLSSVALVVFRCQTVR